MRHSRMRGCTAVVRGAPRGLVASRRANRYRQPGPDLRTRPYAHPPRNLGPGHDRRCALGPTSDLDRPATPPDPKHPAPAHRSGPRTRHPAPARATARPQPRPSEMGPGTSGPSRSGSATSTPTSQPTAHGSATLGPAAYGSATLGSATRGPAAHGAVTHGSAARGGVALGSVAVQ